MLGEFSENQKIQTRLAELEKNWEEKRVVLLT
jgi:hypothetical protein